MKTGFISNRVTWVLETTVSCTVKGVYITPSLLLSPALPYVAMYMGAK